MTGLPYMIRLVAPTLGLYKPKAPVGGMDVAGRVEAVGRQDPVPSGDEVFGWCDGSYAEASRLRQGRPAPSDLSSK
jgi:NADPH:quinone reductase-like Zn-dependent oxidoreductase